MIIHIRPTVDTDEFECTVCHGTFYFTQTSAMQNETDFVTSNDVPPFCPLCGKVWNA